MFVNILLQNIINFSKHDDILFCLNFIKRGIICNLTHKGCITSKSIINVKRTVLRTIITCIIYAFPAIY